MPGDDIDDLIRLSWFTAIAKDIVSETTVRGVLDRVMERIGECFAPLNWSLLLLDRRTEELVFRIAVGKAGERLAGRRIPATEGVAGWVLANAQALIVEDAASDPRFSARADGLTGFRTESIIAVPLRTDERAFGVIELINKLDGSRFSALELRTLSTIADFAAIAIQRAVYLGQLRREAMTDPLTGLLNRRGLERALERERRRVARYGGELAFILADIDGFKQINDLRGHAAGDEVLKRVAATLRAASRSCDAAARFGGDEFLVLLPGTGPEAAEAARERFAAALEKAAVTCAGGHFTVSLGVHAGEAADAEGILHRSDIDLYRRKEDRATPSFGETVLEAMDEEDVQDAAR
ncbi:MAG: sensor domain-containing diguanylate cyclase [Spirochaetales bacterium]|nr:sensor domain-containing diguanylate cyclase [Spirochaetales bacterium]